MKSMVAVVLLAVGLVGAASAQAARPAELTLPGPTFFPESVTAAPAGTLFVSSIVTGEIVRFAPGSSRPETFVADDVDVGTAGVMADPRRNVLWACAVDLSFKTGSYLRGFDLRTGALRATYPLPDGGVCGDITLARGAVYATDTTGGRIMRLTGTRHRRAEGGTLAVWSADPKLAGGGPLKINGIAFDRRRTLYTTNYTTGELFAVRIGRHGSARPAVPIALDQPLTNPDGLRWHRGRLYVADNATGLSRIDVRTRTRTLIDGSLDQPTSLVFVGGAVWITEGQVLRLQAGQPPNLPFKVVRRRAPGWTDQDGLRRARSMMRA
jgi:sugar lactone lactonase YvrE